MKKNFLFGLISLLTISLLASCGAKSSDVSSNTESKQTPPSQSSSKPSSTSKDPAKKLENVSISLGNSGEKAYITVRCTPVNYSGTKVLWAWGLKDANTDVFVDGKAKPDSSDFAEVEIKNNGDLEVKYCLTDIQDMKSGALYRIYGGTPETYGDIGFTSNMFGATDATRKYYLRQDQDNCLTYDSIQPFSYTMASIVELTDVDKPEGITNAGAYLKFGAVNTKNVSEETINAWNQAGNIAGNFQRVIGEGYLIHDQIDEERFWKIEDGNVFFYLYVGFIAENEGWMVHFDVVSGNAGNGCSTDKTFNGETTYTIGGAKFKIYSDSNKSGEENYWGCLGVYREAN